MVEPGRVCVMASCVSCESVDVGSSIWWCKVGIYAVSNLA